VTAPGTGGQRRRFPSQAPAVECETGGGYASRLADACGPAAVPRDHRRSRRCSVGRHPQRPSGVRFLADIAQVYAAALAGTLQ
jgi:hypothetical protein